MSENKIEIIPFSSEYASAIKTLNFEWLEKYFEVEDSDIKTLSNPQLEIIDKGGKIFYAKYQNLIVGTVSLLKIDECTFELSKMAVTEKLQGLGFGKLLMNYCFSFAKENQIKKLIDRVTEMVGERPFKIGFSTPGVLDPGTQRMKNCNTVCMNDQAMKEANEEPPKKP